MINYPSILGAPEIQASDLVVSEVSDTQFRVTIGNLGNGYSVLIVIKASSSGLTRPLFNNTYTANSVFGSGSDLGQGNYVVGKGVSTVLVTGLSASTTYNIYAYGFNVKGNGTEKYNITTATNNPVTQATLAPQVAPTVQATDLIFLGDRRLRCTRGNGQFIIVLAKSGGAVDSHPVDNTTYTAGAFGSGSQIGTGNYVVYIGTADANGLDILSLTYGGSYGVRAYEFNVGSGNPKYNTNTATGNPITASMPSVVTYYHYLNKPKALMTHRSPYNMLASGARDGSQKYITCIYRGSTEVQSFMVTEGDNNVRLSGIDRTSRARHLIGDSPITPSNWYEDTPLDAYGDSPSFLDSSCLQYDLYDAGTTYNISDRVRTGNTNQQVWSALKNGTVGVTPFGSTASSSLVVGRLYKIASAGTSNFTLVGAANNNVGTEFTATGTTPGTGTATSAHWDEVVMWDGNQCWAMTPIEFTHLGTPYQIMIYVANRFIAARYGVGMAVSTDEFETVTRFSSPFIAESANFAAYYIRLTPQKLSDGFWYAVPQNYVPSLLVEGHLYCGQLWRTSQDPNPVAGTWGGWANYSGTVDIFSGRNYGGAVDISNFWIDGTKLCFYLNPNNAGETGAFQAAGEGLAERLSTFPVGNTILECSIEIADLNDFKNKHIIERIIYTSPRLSEIELRTMCQKITRGLYTDIYCFSFLHAYQTLLGSISQNEPKNDSSILSTELDLTDGILVGNEVYPNWIDLWFMPNVAAQNDVLGSIPIPYYPLLQTNGTVVNSPGVGRANSILADGGLHNGYVTGDNWAHSSTQMSVRVVVGENSNSTEFGIICQDDPTGERGWTIWRPSLNRFRVKVYGSNNTSYKEYEFTISSNKSNSDSALMNWIGFIVEQVAGSIVLRGCVDWNLNCTATVIRNDSFAEINVSDAPLMVGRSTVDDNTFKLSQDIVGQVIGLSGANATDEHYLYNNLIGY